MDIETKQYLISLMNDEPTYIAYRGYAEAALEYGRREGLSPVVVMADHIKAIFIHEMPDSIPEIYRELLNLTVVARIDWRFIAQQFIEEV
jgi:hypothetical protein